MIKSSVLINSRIMTVSVFAFSVKNETKCHQYSENNVTVSCCNKEDHLLIDQCDEVFEDSTKHTCCVVKMRKNLNIDTSKVSSDEDDAYLETN